MLLTSLYFTAADFCGRVNPAQISDKKRLELMFAALTDESKSKLQDVNGEFLDIREWSFVRLNDDRNVYSLSTSTDVELSGTVDFAWLPASISSVYFQQQDINGTLETRSFPSNIRIFNIAGGGLTGTVDLTGLPASFVAFSVADHAFHGSVNFTALPAVMKGQILA